MIRNYKKRYSALWCRLALMPLLILFWLAASLQLAKADDLEMLDILPLKPSEKEKTVLSTDRDAPELVTFAKGVQYYRAGLYQDACRLFVILTRKQPENTRYLYYLAISEARLGRFEDAKNHYQAILSINPDASEATLAKIGLSYLPKTTNQLDLPPQFQPPPSRANGIRDGETLWNKGVAEPWRTSALPSGSREAMQNWQALQMLMGGQATPGSSPGGMESMLPWMIQQQGFQGKQNPAVLSEMMNSMMMNQLFSTDGNNR